MSYSEIIGSFDESRQVFKPYGLTCLLWTPTLMKRADRHNEIELNFFPQGGVTYQVQDQQILIPANKLVVFWGLIPHRIVHYESKEPYYVCTIPFAQFLEWKLPGAFVELLLKGELLMENSEEAASHDVYAFNLWINDIHQKEKAPLIALEVHARLRRMAMSLPPSTSQQHAVIQAHEIDPVEQIALYIAQNYHRPIKVTDIGQDRCKSSY